MRQIARGLHLVLDKQEEEEVLCENFKGRKMLNIVYINY